MVRRALVNNTVARAGGLAFALVMALSLALSGTAQAKRVLVLGRGGHVSARNDRYVPATEPIGPAPGRHPHRGHATARAAAAGPTVPSALQTLYSQGQISST